MASTTTTTKVTHQTAKTQYVTDPKKDIKYAYRLFGANSSSDKHPPLLFLMHFRGTMDYWDPELINAIAAERPVLLFDNAGVGQSTGAVADDPTLMAQHILTFLSLAKIKKIDLFGFSLGGIIAPLVYLNANEGLKIRKMILAGTCPTYGEETQQFTPEEAKILDYAGLPNADYDGAFTHLFFYPSETSQAAGRAWYKRIFERNEQSSGEKRSELVSAGYADGGVGLQALLATSATLADPAWRENGSYDRLGEIKIPVFVAQGLKDVMIPTYNSYVLQQRLPDARLKIFPDSGHGFLYQYAVEFAEDVNRFLNL